MAINSSNIVTEGLVYYFDFSNPKCFISGSSTVYNLSGYVNTTTASNRATASLINSPRVEVTGSQTSLMFYSESLSVGPYIRMQSLKVSLPVHLSITFKVTGSSNIGSGPTICLSNPSDGLAHSLISIVALPTSSGNYTGASQYYSGSSKVATASAAFDMVYTANGIHTISSNFSGSFWDLYVNGVFHSMITNSVPLIKIWNEEASSYNLMKVERTGVSDVLGVGRLYEGKIYNRVLTAKEILQNYNAAKRKYR